MTLLLLATGGLVACLFILIAYIIGWSILRAASRDRDTYDS